MKMLLAFVFLILKVYTYYRK